MSIVLSKSNAFYSFLNLVKLTLTVNLFLIFYTERAFNRTPVYGYDSAATAAAAAAPPRLPTAGIFEKNRKFDMWVRF